MRGKYLHASFWCNQSAMSGFVAGMDNKKSTLRLPTTAKNPSKTKTANQLHSKSFQKLRILPRNPDEKLQRVQRKLKTLGVRSSKPEEFSQDESV